MTLLAANLERTPAERLRELVAMNRFQAELQARTVPCELRRRMDAEELMAKFSPLLAGAMESAVWQIHCQQSLRSQRRP